MDARPAPFRLLRRIPLRPRRLPLPRNWVVWALAMVCVAVIALAVSSIGASSSASSAAQRTATVGRGVVQSTVSGNGSLEPAQQVELSFGASGEVTAIYTRAGQKVEKGEVLARVDSSAAQASLASARAKLSEAEEAVLSAEEAEAEASEAESAESAGGSAEAAESVETAEANLREAELSVRSARREVRETTLRAPISGTVASVSGEVGETVSGEGGGASSSAFIVVAQLHRLKMEVSFSEADIGKVETGQTATVAVDSLEGTELAGKVVKVSVLPSESSSGVVEYPATILLSQTAKGLRAGMSASAEVVVEEVKNALTVSNEAIASGGSKTVTVEEGGKEVTKTVTTGLVGDETTQIVSGLKAGETVVLPEATVTAASGAGEAGATAGGEGGEFPGGAAGFSGSGGPPAASGISGGP